MRRNARLTTPGPERLSITHRCRFHFNSLSKLTFRSDCRLSICSQRSSREREILARKLFYFSFHSTTPAWMGSARSYTHMLREQRYVKFRARFPMCGDQMWMCLQQHRRPGLLHSPSLALNFHPEIISGRWEEIKDWTGADLYVYVSAYGPLCGYQHRREFLLFTCRP